jgi:hypothetical protein
MIRSWNFLDFKVLWLVLKSMRPGCVLVVVKETWVAGAGFQVLLMLQDVSLPCFLTCSDLVIQPLVKYNELLKLLESFIVQGEGIFDLVI